MHTLEIINLHAKVGDKEILKGLNLKVSTGEVHAIMGPNGAGKSTLSNVVLGHPNYEIINGDIKFDGKSILELSTDERARLGIFLAFQYPIEIPGITVSNFLRTAYSAIRYGISEDKQYKLVSVVDFREKLNKKAKTLNFTEEYADRYLNFNFSGGEKKRSDILQMLVLEPKIAILDETDSGLDIDSLKIVANAINMVKKNLGLLMITHYNRILKYIKPTHVHVMIDGKIVEEGDHRLAIKLEKNGYAGLKKPEAIRTINDIRG